MTAAISKIFRSQLCWRRYIPDLIPDELIRCVGNCVCPVACIRSCFFREEIYHCYCTVFLGQMKQIKMYYIDATSVGASHSLIVISYFLMSDIDVTTL